MKVKNESEVAQSCLTLRDPMDCSPPGSSIHGIFQARVLEWGASIPQIAKVWTPTKFLSKDEWIKNMFLHTHRQEYHPTFKKGNPIIYDIIDKNGGHYAR